ncbi:MAG: phosphonate ABC transporter, permease protein PhnE [Betaproteobacteria bacterium]|nr:phosphonate ABC transporter, permease protein PhnE [Betaproteobacteria bacterium]
MAAACDALEAGGRGRWHWLKIGLVAAAVIGFYAACAWLARVDLPRLVEGLPKLAFWIGQAWPPAIGELPVILLRTAETIAIAVLGTTLAVLLALPTAVFASRNITPLRWAYHPVRWFLNSLRGIDAFVFALILVAAVGLGPFAGMLGVALHTWGSAAKLFADQVESASLDTVDAMRTTGATRSTALAYALVPQLAPVTASTALYLFEFNVRASMVLGVVGAGGIGQELKNSMDLLDFARLATILAVMLLVVTVIDQASGALRARLK